MIKKLVLVILCVFAINIVSCDLDTSVRLQEEKNDIMENGNIEIIISKEVENGEVIFQDLSDVIKVVNDIYPVKKLRIGVSKRISSPNYSYEIKCTPEDLNKESLVKQIISCSYDIHDNWIIEGVYGIFLSKIYGTSPYYNAELLEEYNSLDFVDYYAEHDFSLFGARFFKDYASKDEGMFLKQASRTLVSDLLSRGKKEQLFNGGLTISDLEPWADEYSISIDYLKTIFNETAGFQVSEPSLQSLIIKSKKDINGFTIKILSKNEMYNTAFELEQILKTFAVSQEENLRNIRELAPTFYEEYMIPLTNVPHITYIFDYKSYGNYADYNTEITLRQLPAQIIEYNHVLLSDSFLSNNLIINRPYWLIEGLDAYIGYTYNEASKDIPKSMVIATLTPITQDERERFSERELSLMELQQKILKANFTDKELTNLDDTLQERDNIVKIMHIFNSSYLNYSDLIPPSMSYVNSLIESNSFQPSSLDKENTSDLIDRASGQNYFSNFSFTSFLAEEYGLEKLLYLGVLDKEKTTFKEIFGKSYDELYIEWQNHLMNEIVLGELIVGEIKK